jgi:hypothetical protein
MVGEPMMTNDPLWPLFLITHVGGIVVGAILATLWWRRHCSHLAAGEAQHRRDRRERIERLTAPAEVGGGKSRDRAATLGDVLAHVHRTGHATPVDAGRRPLPPTPPPIEPDPRLDNYVLEGGKPKLTSPVDARRRVIPPPPPPPTYLPGWY